MKRILSLGLMFISITAGSVVFGQDKKPVSTKTATKPKPKTTIVKPAKAAKADSVVSTAAPKEVEGIHWITLKDAEVKMREKPKKVFIDIYTGWCGWCQRMEATTFQNPALIKYINNNYYAVRFDAETHEKFQFNGKEYHFEPQYKANTFAVELLKGQMGYPTSVFMMENFQNPQVIPGYHPVKEMEMFLLYFGDNICIHKQMPDYQKTFVSTWDHGETPEMAPPAGH